MSKTATEYVRGIPVVKVFQQTVHSFKAFHDAINEYSEMAENYAVKVCAKPQVTSLTIINGIAIFLVPVVVLIAPAAYQAGSVDFATFIADFAFYAIFSAIIATACTRLMFVMEEIEISQDAAKRLHALLASPVLKNTKDPQVPHDHSIAFENVSFRYEGAEVMPYATFRRYSTRFDRGAGGAIGWWQDHHGKLGSALLGCKLGCGAHWRRGCARY